MQVKKFEAKSMKDALELVKIHLGPEAIILSAKDTHKGFGLMGEKSVEVTAAVTDETLRKKKIAESKLREDVRKRFSQISATKQKEFINKVFKQDAPVAPAKEPVIANSLDPVAPELRAQLKGLRYIDIEDEEPDMKSRGRDRVRSAVARARAVSQPVMEKGVATKAERVPTHEVQLLQRQVAELKDIVTRFQSVPQVPLSLHPGADQGLPFELSQAFQRLTSQGLQATAVAGWLKQAQSEMDRESLGKPALVDAWMIQKLLKSVQVCTDPTRGRYHVFMGATGQGKTTQLVKFAAHLIMRERKKIAIVSLDTLKLGATEQLRLFAQILNVPFAVVRDPTDWKVAHQKLKHVHHVLVDGPGLNLQTPDQLAWLRNHIPPVDLDRRLHFVQSILSRDEEAVDIAARYQAIGFDDVIFTRLDEAGRYGLILNFQDRFRTPIHSFGVGPGVPEDFEIATKERIVDLLFRLSATGWREAKS